MFYSIIQLMFPECDSNTQHYVSKTYASSSWATREFLSLTDLTWPDNFVSGMAKPIDAMSILGILH